MKDFFSLRTKEKRVYRQGRKLETERKKKLALITNTIVYPRTNIICKNGRLTDIKEACVNL